jgi:hypothetical protein
VVRDVIRNNGDYKFMVPDVVRKWNAVNQY